jgi:hypothetical protein
VCEDKSASRRRRRNSAKRMREIQGKMGKEGRGAKVVQGGRGVWKKSDVRLGT